MGDGIESYDPDNLGRLARKLSDLATTLERDLGRIRSALLEAEGHPPSNGKSAMVIAKAREDARDMLSRARLAREIARREDLEQLFVPLTGASWPKGFVRLDWAATSQSGFQAQQDAKALQAALANKNSAASRAELFLLARSLRAHLDDKDYLNTFWAAAGPQAAALARSLHRQDGDFKAVLTEQDKNILNAFGTSLATAAKNGVLSKQAQESFTKTGDLWSATMLLKFGPSGKEYGSKGAPFLAQMGRTVLDSRINGRSRSVGTHWWFPDDSGYFQSEYQPTLAVLQRLGENNRAARLLTGDPETGLRYVRELVGNPWVYVGSVGVYDYSDYAGNVLKAAANHRRGSSDDARLATQSVANLMLAVNEFHDTKKEGRALPEGLRHAMTDISIAYIPDLAVSSPNADGNPPDPELTGITHFGNEGGPLHVSSTRDQIKVFLDETLIDPKDLGRFKGALNAQFSWAVNQTVQSSKTHYGANYISKFANLRGLIQKVEADQNLQGAAAKDAAAEEKKMFFSMLTAGFGSIPGGKTLDGAKAFVGIAQPAMDGMFDTGNQARVAAANTAIERNLAFSMNIPVVQGLLDSGELKVKSGTPGFKNGKVIPGKEFNSWYASNELRLYAGRELQQWVYMAQHGVKSQTN